MSFRITDFDRTMDGVRRSGERYSFEVERVLRTSRGSLSPIADIVLSDLDPQGSSAEPPAWQLEGKSRGTFVTGRALRADITGVLDQQNRAAHRNGTELLAEPLVCDGKPPVWIYPSEEYRALARMLAARGDIQAVFAVASTQFNINCSGPVQALRRYNRLVEDITRLIDMFCFTRRLAVYETAAPNSWPRIFSSPSDLHVEMVRRGITNPSKMHTLVQIKAGWVIEVRLVDAVADPIVIDWMLDELLRTAGH